MPESEVKRMFKDHLKDLRVTSNPTVEVIKPRSGKSSFLKITFMTGGEKENLICSIKPLKMNMKPGH